MGDRFAVLNGAAAGETYELIDCNSTDQPIASEIGIPLGQPPRQRTLSMPHELLGKLPLEPPPLWFPPLSLRDTFVIDELATWFCERGMETGNFRWNDTLMDEVIRTVWQKRIPITAAEITSFFAAHGLTEFYHDLFFRKFNDGMRLLIWTVRRAPQKTKRMGSFDGTDRDPRRWFDKFILPGFESQN